MKEKNSITQPKSNDEQPIGKLSESFNHSRLGNELRKKFVDSLLKINKEKFGVEGLFNFDVDAIVNLALSKAVFNLIEKDNGRSHEINKHRDALLKHS